MSVGFGPPYRLRLLAERSVRDNASNRSTDPTALPGVVRMSGSLKRGCRSRFLLERGVLDDASIAVHDGPAALPASRA
ncbi:hypothetical protein [Xanthomonas graminis]|jgi:hypothetical protein|uniref:Uncharacterized protein n=1 Tax=Xanthomonas graminis pv. graminis TaxID=134874 RepID=A0A1M4L8H1_9XANT|nr:hypothetical protein [Xanthomonas translucens]EKU23581.1 hypothetical protein XTG29_03682 [Xanthomonas translucens pv. graminis ART-Xtg29]SBV44677.1 hypothetical protein XTGART2_3434 [Xanthomonas translucens pv. graminis]SBV45302.1 hypothetical protein XTGART9_3428 [Xanthomonas translucens pv. graminis]SBV48787.1 hypothetical protein XTGART29_3463 [Xanthomonas translucens pv. graminis ART-Xtg29]SBV56773.1 hypothetical protein XTGART10_3442 [Xanthomonas translucens pv. graminis]